VIQCTVSCPGLWALIIKLFFFQPDNVCSRLWTHKLHLETERCIKFSAFQPRAKRKKRIASNTRPSAQKEAATTFAGSGQAVVDSGSKCLWRKSRGAKRGTALDCDATHAKHASDIFSPGTTKREHREAPEGTCGCDVFRGLRRRKQRRFRSTQQRQSNCLAKHHVCCFWRQRVRYY